MTNAVLDLDLDAPPALTRPPRWRTNLPWVLFGVVLAALAISIAFRMPDPVAAAEELPAAPATEPTELEMEQTGGVSPGPTVWRDEAGALIAVMFPVSPYNQETVGCRLVVDGREIVDEGTDGYPAICVWVRDAT